MFISPAFAQDVSENADIAAGAGSAFLSQMLLIGLLVFLFYVLMIRPQQKRMKEHQAMLGGLDKGSKIVTQGGLVGVVDKVVDEREMIIKVGDVKLNILRSSVMSTYEEAIPAAANDTQKTSEKTPKKSKKK